MKQIRAGLKQNLDVSIYAKPIFKASQMKEIRLALSNNIEMDLNSFINN